jgi:hypothetical protein
MSTSIANLNLLITAAAAGLFGAASTGNADGTPPGASRSAVNVTAQVDAAKLAPRPANLRGLATMNMGLLALPASSAGTTALCYWRMRASGMARSP